MEHRFWHEIWNKPHRGFHLDSVNPLLPRFLPKLSDNANILVPLCGKSHDLTWLCEQGFAVDGIELSKRAIDEYWQENGVTPDEYVQPPFSCTRAGCLNLWQGDIFDLAANHLSTPNLIYDRAALVAWPETMRAQYVEKLTEIAKPDCLWLLITLDYPQREMDGPPFSVTPKTLKSLTERHWSLEHLHTEDILVKEPHFQNRGLSYLLESVWLLSRKNS